VEGVIVGVDESPCAEAALRWAVDHAAHAHQPLTAVMAWGYLDQHHVEASAPFDPQYTSAIAAKVLDELVARAGGIDGAVAREVVCDLPAEALLRAGRDASLLVVGARGMGGFRGLVLGSVSRQVLHRSNRPVAVVRDAALRSGLPVVVGVDGSGPSRRALQWALDHARRRQLPLIAVHAWHLPSTATDFYAPWPDPAELAERADRLVRGELGGVDTTGLIAPVELRVVPDRPAAALVEDSRLASLVVVGSRGHGQLANTLLGSVSDHVAHHAGCPVVVVP
jgi:nucleotide-binding universal stress UspA family protein